MAGKRSFSSFVSNSGAPPWPTANDDGVFPSDTISFPHSARPWRRVVGHAIRVALGMVMVFYMLTSTTLVAVLHDTSGGRPRSSNVRWMSVGFWSRLYSGGDGGGSGSGSRRLIDVGSKQLVDLGVRYGSQVQGGGAQAPLPPLVQQEAASLATEPPEQVDRQRAKSSSVNKKVENEGKAPRPEGSKVMELRGELEPYWIPLEAEDPIESYIQRRAKVEQGDEPRAGNGYVAFVPDEGLGNRLRGLVSTFLLAMILDRTFLVYWTEPCDWSLQFANTLPWEWDLTQRPELYALHTQGDPRSLYICLTQFKCDESRNTYRHELEHGNLTSVLNSETYDLVIVQDPDEYISLLARNPAHAAAVDAVVNYRGKGYAEPRSTDLKTGGARNYEVQVSSIRTFSERVLGRLMAPSERVVEMMAPYRGKYQHAIHVRSQFCKGGMGPVLDRLSSQGPYVNDTFFVAVDKTEKRHAIVRHLQDVMRANVMFIDLPPVHSNDKLPSGATEESYVSLMADFFLLAETRGDMFLTDQSSFSESALMINQGHSAHHWFCGKIGDR